LALIRAYSLQGAVMEQGEENFTAKLGAEIIHFHGFL
jgi:hypothetical protein